MNCKPKPNASDMKFKFFFITEFELAVRRLLIQQNAIDVGVDYWSLLGGDPADIYNMFSW